jgi:hypothetical protein
MKTREEYDDFLESNKPFTHVEMLENVYGEFGTYSNHINIIESNKTEFFKVTKERRTGKAIKDAEFPSDDINYLLVERVEKVDDKWKTVEVIYVQEHHYNNYNDGDTFVKTL